MVLNQIQTSDLRLNAYTLKLSAKVNVSRPDKKKKAYTEWSKSDLCIKTLKLAV